MNIAEKNKCNAHVANQFSLTSNSTLKNKQSQSWPLDRSQENLNREIFPKSWSACPVNGLFFQRNVS